MHCSHHCPEKLTTLPAHSIYLTKGIATITAGSARLLHDCSRLGHRWLAFLARCGHHQHRRRHRCYRLLPRARLCAPSSSISKGLNCNYPPALIKHALTPTRHYSTQRRGNGACRNFDIHTPGAVLRSPALLEPRDKHFRPSSSSTHSATNHRRRLCELHALFWCRSALKRAAPARCW